MNFKLRPLRTEDRDALVKYANNEKVSGNMTDFFPYPYTNKDAVSFLKRFNDKVPNQVFAIEINGEMAGAIGIHPQEDIMRYNAELGYWLAEPYWGKGIMTNAIKQMLEYGFKTFDINRIYARPFGSNIGSQRALEKAGFTLEARLKQTIVKRGKLEDELIYAYRKNDVHRK